VDQGKLELGGSGVAPPYGQIPVYDQRIQYEGGYRGPVEIQQTGTVQRSWGMSRRGGSWVIRGRGEVKRDPVEMPS
jgi:hypothetical protein